MTKEEKIKEAYGRFYKPEKYHFSVNGWVDLNEWLEYEVGLKIQTVNLSVKLFSGITLNVFGRIAGKTCICEFK